MLKKKKDFVKTMHHITSYNKNYHDNLYLFNTSIINKKKYFLLRINIYYYILFLYLIIYYEIN